MAGADAVRYEVIFTGRVQGVFFRATTEEIARRFDVSGWVRNEADGSVKLVVEGSPAELDRFVAAVQKAKQENIEDIDISRHPATGQFNGFTIRR